jgi:hypothetical protein
MLGRINNPRRWPAEAPATHEQLRQFDRTLPAYGPDSDPRIIPSKDGRDNIRLAAGLEAAEAMAESKPIGIRILM